MQTRSIFRAIWMLLGSKTVAYAMVGGFVIFACLVNFPGHLSLDSLVQLSEGRNGNFVSFNPPFASVLIALFDRIHAGTGLLMIFNIIMFGLALILMLHTLPRTNPLSNLLLLAMLASPITLIYNGIIWKDVIFANFALLAFSLLITCERQPNWSKTLLIIILLAMASLIRQQGIIIALIASLAMPFVLRWRQQSHWLSRIGLGLGTFLVMITLSKLLFLLATLGTSGANSGAYSTPILLLMLYDIAGMVKYRPDIDLSILAKAGSNVPLLKQLILNQYTAQRIDTLDLFSALPPARSLYTDVVRQWIDLLTNNPGAYLTHRINVFFWQLGLHDQTLCLPVHVGFDVSNNALIQKLSLKQTGSPYSHRLWLYAKTLFNTPIFSGAFYILMQLAVVSILLLKGLKHHLAAATLAIAGILFSLSYFVVGIACDLRYIYFTLISSMFCAVYVAARLSDKPIGN